MTIPMLQGQSLMDNYTLTSIDDLQYSYESGNSYGTFEDICIFQDSGNDDDMFLNYVEIRKGQKLVTEITGELF